MEDFSTRVEETFSNKVWILTKNIEESQDEVDNEVVELKDAIFKTRGKTRDHIKAEHPHLEGGVER